MHTHLRRAAVPVLAAALVSSALPGPASARKPRRVTVTAAYTGTAALAGRGILVVGFNDDSYGGAVFDPPGTFRRVSVRVADDHAPAAAFVIGQDVDEDGLLDAHEAACAETEAPVEVTPGAPVGVFVQQGPCADGTAAFGTTGRISVTFIP